MASFYENLSNYDPTSDTVSFQNINVSGQMASTTALVGALKISSQNFGNILDPDLLSLGTGALTINGNLITAGLVNGINLQALDTSVVKLTGDQTIAGNKTFSGNTTNSGNLTVSGTTALGTTTTGAISVTGNITVTGTVDGVDVAALSSSVSNVDNTSDANKPVSTATQTALNLKANIASPTFTGTVTADALTMGDNEKITLGTGGDLEIYHDGSHSHILDKGTGSLSIDSAHFAIRSGATDDADTTPTEHLRVVITAGASGTTSFSAGNESSGSLSTGMTNPRLTVIPKIGSNAGQVQVRGSLIVDDDPIDSSATNSAKLSTTGDLSVVGASTLNGGLHIGGDITRSGGTAFTFDHGATFTRTSGDNTALQVLNTGTPSSSFTCYASIEVGGNGGSFIDVKKPSGNDYDLRIEHGITADDQSLISSRYPLIIQTEGAGDGEVTIKREGSTKLATSATGIDVTGTVTADGLVMGDDERIKLGDGTDFQIYHENSTNKSIIKESNASANLQIQGENINITRTDASKSFIQTFDNKDVALYSDGNMKLKTSDGTGSFAAGVNVTGTTTSNRFTGSQTHNIQSGNETMSGHVGEKTICVGATGTVTYTFPDVADGDKGDTWTVVNASDQSITCARSSDTQFSKLVAGSDPATATSVTVAKGGVAEFVVTAANVITVFGSGIS